MSCWSAEVGGSWEAPREAAGTSEDKVLSAHPSCRAGPKSGLTGPCSWAPSLPGAAASLQHTSKQLAPAAGKRQRGSYNASRTGFPMALAMKEVPAPCHIPSPAHMSPAAPCIPQPWHFMRAAPGEVGAAKGTASSFCWQLRAAARTRTRPGLGSTGLSGPAPVSLPV